MKSMSAGVAGRQAGLALALVFSVTLATLLFSFLGTIACGALVGMMLGATRRWRCWVIFVSLVFPVVMAAFLHFSRTDLTDRQLILLPVVCFGLFWLTYLSTCVLLKFEKQGESLTGELVADGAMPQAMPVQENAVSRSRGLSELDELQGTWVQAVPEQGGSPGCKRLEFARERFAVSIVAGGEARRVAEGTVSVEKAGPFAVLKLFDAQPNSPTVAARQAGPSATWIYRISGSMLVLAANFEHAAGGGEPLLERYARLGAQDDVRRNDSQRRATD